MAESIRTLLKDQIVETSAPCRVDSGGTWDIKAMALPFERLVPTTLNIALDLRTHVALHPYKDHRIKIISAGFRHSAEFSEKQLPLDSRFGIFLAAISFFGYHGLAVHIRSQSPVRSALGGSSTALVALIMALSTVRERMGGKGMFRREILHLGYHLEDGISGGHCGVQDQAAAVYGGVHQWQWRYGKQTKPFEKIPLLNRQGLKELSRHLLVAYSGKTHISHRTNRKWVRDFLSGRTREGWIKANEAVHQLALAVKAMDWKEAAACLAHEMSIRKKITPEALIPMTEKLVQEGERCGCGVRFAGAGAGGSLWAIGEEKNIAQLRNKWEALLAPLKGAKILACGVAPDGVR